MNIKEIERKVLDLKSYLERVLDCAEYDSLSWEDKKILECFHRLDDELYTIGNSIQYYRKKSIEGRLHQREDGRFAIDEYNYFTSGSPMEMYLYDDYEEENIWCKGRVEYMHESNREYYYFLNEDGKNKELEEGDLVRIRL